MKTFELFAWVFAAVMFLIIAVGNIEDGNRVQALAACFPVAISITVIIKRS